MLYVCVLFFFFKQKTAYEMRISDWSSDVCSSDLRNVGVRARLAGHADVTLVGECGDGPSALAALQSQSPDLVFIDVEMPGLSGLEEIGRASCRERVCQYV